MTIEIRGLAGAREATPVPGAPVLEALLAAGVRAPHRCREARCGRCRATVTAGAFLLAPAGVLERTRLGPALAQGQRLLCQARVAEGTEGGRLRIEY